MLPIEGMTKHPYGLPLMMEAWASCVDWASKNQELLDAFDKEVNLFKDHNLGAKWADWVTVNIWGEEE